MDLARRGFLAGRPALPELCRPPWSLTESDFTDRCTRCGECIEACPSGLLKAGRGGFPLADFSSAACTFCGDCAEVCRPGAIQRNESLPDAPAWAFVISITQNCLAPQKVFCRTCGESCDRAAIRYLPKIGGAALAVIDSELCNGCGACLAPCPTGAIVRLPIPLTSKQS